MRTVFGLFGSLLLLACLVEPAAADGMHPLNGGGGSFTFAPTPPQMQFHGFMGQDRFVPQRVLRGQALTRQFFLVNPGPVPPLNGTIVPPFSVGSAVNIDRFDNRLFIRKHRFAFGHDRFHQFHRFNRFPGVFPVQPFVFLEEGPNQVVILGNDSEEESDLEATAPEAPPVAPAKPTWRSGKSALTGTLEKPRVIVVSPAPESGSVQIFAPSNKPVHAPQVVEVPAQ
jgi:hypothetical protein